MPSDIETKKAEARETISNLRGNKWKLTLDNIYNGSGQALLKAVAPYTNRKLDDEKLKEYWDNLRDYF